MLLGSGELPFLPASCIVTQSGKCDPGFLAANCSATVTQQGTHFLPARILTGGLYEDGACYSGSIRRNRSSARNDGCGTGPGEPGPGRPFAERRSRQDHLDPEVRGHRHRRPGLGGQRCGAHRLGDQQQRLAGRVPFPRPPRGGGGSHGLGAAAGFPPGHLVHLLRPQHAPVQPPGDPARGSPGSGQLRLVGRTLGGARPGHDVPRAAQRPGRLLEVHRPARVWQARHRARPGPARGPGASASSWTPSRTARWGTWWWATTT